MKMRTNIVLLAVLLALCAGYWFMVRSGEERKAAVIEAKKLFSFAPADVTSITIQREAERATTGARGEGGAWRVTAPLEVPANAMIWERVAKNIAELSNQRPVEDEPKDLAARKG